MRRQPLTLGIGRRPLERTAALFCQALGALEVYDSQDCQFSLSREKFSCSVVYGWR